MTETRDLITPGEDKLQNINYMNPLFYCFAHKNFYPADVSFNIPEHWHEDIEFLYVISGEMEYSVNGKKIVLHENEGILVPPRRIHSNKSPRGVSCNFYCELLHPTYLCVSPYIEKTYVGPLLGNNSFEYLLLKQDDWTSAIIDEIKNLFQYISTSEFELAILESAFRILRIISKYVEPNMQPEPVSGLYISTFKQMVSYINEHYMEKLSLDDIAFSGNVGKTLCAKIFRKFTQKTPGDYLIHYRITRSMTLLSDSELSVTEIAYATGFNSASHFTKTFKSMIGCTPNKYRNSPQTMTAFGKHF